MASKGKSQPMLSKFFRPKGKPETLETKPLSVKREEARQGSPAKASADALALPEQTEARERRSPAVDLTASPSPGSAAPASPGHVPSSMLSAPAPLIAVEDLDRRRAVVQALGLPSAAGAARAPPLVDAMARFAAAGSAAPSRAAGPAAAPSLPPAADAGKLTPLEQQVAALLVSDAPPIAHCRSRRPALPARRCDRRIAGASLNAPRCCPCRSGTTRGLSCWWSAGTSSASSAAAPCSPPARSASGPTWTARS